MINDFTKKKLKKIDYLVNIEVFIHEKIFFAMSFHSFG